MGIQEPADKRQKIMMNTCYVVVLILLRIHWSHEECFFGSDIAIVMDISHTASEVESEELRAFGKQVLSLVSDHDRSLLSLVTYRSEPLIRFTFDDWVVEAARSRFLDVFRKLRSTHSQTHRGMFLLRHKVFTLVNGDRVGIPDVLILITDRPSSNITEAAIRAGFLKSQGVIIFVVAIGAAVGDAEIQKYITKTSNFIRLANFEQLEIGFNVLRNAAFDCSPCPVGWIKTTDDDGYCYKMVKNRMPWQTARDNCAAISKGSRLVTFQNQKQVMWFTSEYNDRGGTGIWIGLSRNATTGTFTYEDGTVLDPTILTWETGYPKLELCAHYSKNGLADDSCARQKQSVCQLKQVI